METLSLFDERKFTEIDITGERDTIKWTCQNCGTLHIFHWLKDGYTIGKWKMYCGSCKSFTNGTLRNGGKFESIEKEHEDYRVPDDKLSKEREI